MVILEGDSKVLVNFCNQRSLLGGTENLGSLHCIDRFKMVGTSTLPDWFAGFWFWPFTPLKGAEECRMKPMALKAMTESVLLKILWIHVHLYVIPV